MQKLTHKTPRRTLQAEHCDKNYGGMFSDQSPKAKETKAKINKWDLMKLKSFAPQKKQ